MIRNIEIRAVLNGFVCNVGCQTVVFDSVNAMVTALTEYVNNPEKTEKEWLTSALNAGKLNQPTPTEPGSLTRMMSEPAGGTQQAAASARR